MDVLQVSKFYHPVVGGIERVVRQLAEGTRDRGHEVSVLAAADGRRGASERVDGVPVRRVGTLGTALSTPLAPTFPIHLARMASDADVVHYHLPNPLAVVSHHLVDPDTATVATYHSDIVRQSRALTIYRPVLRRFLGDVEHIVTTSPRLRDESALLADFQGKTSVVPLAVPLDEIDGESVDDRDPSLSSVTETDRVILFVGRLNYYKGVSYLVRAMQCVEDATLLIAGDGERRDDLESEAARLGLGDRVWFLGYVPDPALARLYDRADVFVLPSIEPSEAFGIVQLEAMARGVPVINTDLPSGVPWVSQDGQTGLTVPPRDAAALAEAIQRLFDDPQIRREYGENARERVEQMFTEDRLIADTVDIYRDLIGR